MIEHGADVRVIQQLPGHAKLETTRIYIEVSIKLLQETHARTHPASQQRGPTPGLPPDPAGTIICADEPP